MIYKTPLVMLRHAAVADLWLLMATEYIVNMLTNIKVFGWTCKYINDSSLMPHLKVQDNDQSDLQSLDKNLGAT